MSYRIEKGEGLAVALGRITAEEMDLALREVRRPDRGEADSQRAQGHQEAPRPAQLAADDFPPEELFRAENQRLADAGRKISPLRDVHVQLRTLGKLQAADDPAGDRMRRVLLRRQENFARKIPVLRKAVRGMLGNSRGMVGVWPLDKTTPVTLVAGLKRVYKQGRSAFKTARKNPAPENLHEWRKKTKALGYGFELIERLVPKGFSKRIAMCQTLGNALGEDHDLFMVLQALGQSNRSQPARDYAWLARRISVKRAKIQKQAFKLGKKVYSKKPRAFAKMP